MSAPDELPREEFRVLVVEDDPDISDQIRALITGWGYDARVSHDRCGARVCLSDWHPDLALIDLGLSDSNGLDVLREFHACRVESIVISGHLQAAKAQTAAFGATVFLEKPVSPTLLRSALAAAERRAREASDTNGTSTGTFDRLGEMVSASPKMREVFDLVRCVAPTDANVLITGENGTGKELVANAIHSLSPRRNGPFIKVNCAAIPDELIESELFGHRRGAFTGAIADRVGLFESAVGGTLMLDEIGEMPAHLQCKLLRVLQERQARPVGAVRHVNLDFRLICATNSNLRAAATQGDFRQDLYFRVNTFSIDVPALRDRPEDIPLLAAHFLDRFGERHGHAAQPLHRIVRDALLRHDWRGNVRELEHAIERAVIVSRGMPIRLEHLPEHLLRPRQAPAAAGGAPPIMPLAELERLAILRTLEHTRGNKRAAAALLGVYRPTLYSKLRKYGITSADLHRS